MAVFVSTKTEIHPRTLVILLAAGALGSLAVMPYFTSLFAGETNVFVLAGVAALLAGASALAAVVGLQWGAAFGLGAPRLQNWATDKADPGGWRATFQWSIPIAIVLAAIVYVGDRYWFAGAFQKAYQGQAWWKKVGAGLYAGTSEELVLRLFLMAALVKFLSWAKVTRTRAVVTALLLSGVASMAVHVPGGLRYEPFSWMVFGHTLVHHGVPGAVYGWLFWRRGVESAMTAHGLTELLVSLAMTLAPHA